MSASTQGRIQSVEKLLTISSAAKKIESSDNQEAKDMLASAKSELKKASQAIQANDEETAKSHLSKATITLFKAAKLADGGEAIKETAKNRYNDRKESVEALLNQHRAVASEKNVSSEAELVEADVLTGIAEAAEMAKIENYTEGRKILDQAYDRVKISLIKMRDGQQLVNSLIFDTPKDEYAYYVKKIASQNKAIGVFSEHIKPGRKKMIDSILTKAGDQQSQAETLANSDNYQEALPLMESALNKLRSALMMVVR